MIADLYTVEPERAVEALRKHASRSGFRAFTRLLGLITMPLRGLYKGEIRINGQFQPTLEHDVVRLVLRLWPATRQGRGLPLYTTTLECQYTPEGVIFDVRFLTMNA